ncbi:MAG: HigA family addiction module antidote protein [Verrucomicrobiae bacterium]|nr:HigA family addiction module antidote protein [Verrucomicrobiae bacterium]
MYQHATNQPPRRPAEVFPPGDFIREELDERDWTQGDLAKIIGRPEAAINLIVNDKRGITPDTAVELAAAFDTSAEYWLNLDTAYRLSKVAAPTDEIQRRASIYRTSPVKEMVRRGWINYSESAEGLAFEVEKFYSVVDFNEMKLAARSSDSGSTPTAEQLAWCVRCLHLARSIPVRRYVEWRLPECKAKLRKLAAFPESVAAVPKVLAEFGIRYVLVEHIKRSKIDGAALWLGSEWDKPVIALSLRYDRIDWFWHTLCHELSHIEHKDGSSALIDVDMSVGGDDAAPLSEIEARANREAAEMLIPVGKIDSYILRKRPTFSRVSVLQFANANKIHPGIVVGQLHHRLGNYQLFRDMLVRIKGIAITTALHDGWGSESEE